MTRLYKLAGKNWSDVRATDYNGRSNIIPGSPNNDLACPYFMPVEKLLNGSWPHPTRLPLGGGWRGHCTAPQHENETPPQDVLEAFCNLGYATGCSWAPQERKWDAVRFAVSARRSDTKDDSSHLIRIGYVCERNHLPVERGDLEVNAQQLHWVKSHLDPRLQKMAECFLKSRLEKNN